VNCYFWENEVRLYEAFIRDAGQFEKFSFNFNENKTQENGHIIYKFTAKYDSKINCEIQIKSVMHNVWGEVEHKTVYKNRNYDGFVESKKNITEVIYDILQASDKQLESLFREVFNLF
jgi:ppGpp synthetase/RelA/SpoT-type nucleotidyltranferase